MRNSRMQERVGPGANRELGIPPLRRWSVGEEGEEEDALNARFSHLRRELQETASPETQSGLMCNIYIFRGSVADYLQFQAPYVHKT